MNNFSSELQDLEKKLYDDIEKGITNILDRTCLILTEHPTWIPKLHRPREGYWDESAQPISYSDIPGHVDPRNLPYYISLHINDLYIGQDTTSISTDSIGTGIKNNETTMEQDRNDNKKLENCNGTSKQQEHQQKSQTISETSEECDGNVTSNRTKSTIIQQIYGPKGTNIQRTPSNAKEIHITSTNTNGHEQHMASSETRGNPRTTKRMGRSRSPSNGNRHGPRRTRRTPSETSENTRRSDDDSQSTRSSTRSTSSSKSSLRLVFSDVSEGVRRVRRGPCLFPLDGDLDLPIRLVVRGFPRVSLLAICCSCPFVFVDVMCISFALLGDTTSISTDSIGTGIKNNETTMEQDRNDNKKLENCNGTSKQQEHQQKSQTISETSDECDGNVTSNRTKSTIIQQIYGPKGTNIQRTPSNAKEIHITSTNTNGHEQHMASSETRGNPRTTKRMGRSRSPSNGNRHGPRRTRRTPSETSENTRRSDDDSQSTRSSTRSTSSSKSSLRLVFSDVSEGVRRVRRGPCLFPLDGDLDLPIRLVVRGFPRVSLLAICCSCPFVFVDVMCISFALLGLYDDIEKGITNILDRTCLILTEHPTWIPKLHRPREGYWDESAQPISYSDIPGHVDPRNLPYYISLHINDLYIGQDTTSISTDSIGTGIKNNETTMEQDRNDNKKLENCNGTSKQQEHQQKSQTISETSEECDGNVTSNRTKSTIIQQIYGPKGTNIQRTPSNAKEIHITSTNTNGHEQHMASSETRGNPRTTKRMGRSRSPSNGNRHGPRRTRRTPSETSENTRRSDDDSQSTRSSTRSTSSSKSSLRLVFSDVSEGVRRVRRGPCLFPLDGDLDLPIRLVVRGFPRVSLLAICCSCPFVFVDVMCISFALLGDTTSISTDSIGTGIKNNETTMEQDRNDNKKLENCNGTSKQQEHQQKSQTISETSDECDGNVTSNRTKSTIIQQIYGPKGTNIQRTPSNAKEIHITSTNTNGHEQHMASSETRGNPRTTKRMGRSRSPSNGNRHGPRRTRRTPSETSENTRRSDDLLLLVDLVLLLVDCESSSLRLVFSDVSEGVRRVRRGPCLFPLDGDLDLPIRLVVRGFPRVSLLAICCSCPFVFVDVMCISFALLGLYDDIEKGITNILDRTCLILTEHPTWIPKLHRPREGYWDESAQPISYSDIPGHVDPRNLPYYISLHINDLYIGQDTTSISTDSIGTGIKNNETTMEQDRNDNKKLENCNGTSKQQEHQQKSQTISETSEECDGNVTSNRAKSTIIQQIYGPKGTNIQRTPSNAKKIHITSTNTKGHEQHMASSETRGNPRTTKRMGRSRSPSNGNRLGPRRTRRTPSETSENTRRSDDDSQSTRSRTRSTSSSKYWLYDDIEKGITNILDRTCLILTEHPTWIPKLHRPREGYWDESAQPISYSDIPGHVDPRNLPYYISLHINDLYIGQDTTSISTDSIGTGIKNNETTMEQDRNDNKKLENCNGTSKQQEHQQKSQTISETSEECDGNVTSNRTKSTIIQQIYGPKGTNIQRTPSNAKEIHITSTNTNGHEQHMASSETRGNPRTTKRMGRSRSPSNGNRHGPRRTRRTPSETSENTRRSDDLLLLVDLVLLLVDCESSSLRLVFSDVSEGVRRVRRGPCLFPLDGDLDLPIRLVVRGFPRVSLLAICCSCPFVFVDVMCISFALLGLYDDIEKGITNILDRTCLILTEHPTWIPKLHRPREGYWDESAQPISYSDIPGHVDPRNLPYYISLHINDLYIGQDTTSISTDSIGTGIKNNETTMEQDRNDNKKLENCNGTSKQQEHQQKSQTISETSEECDGNVTSNRTKSTIIQQIYGPKGTNIQRTPSNAKEIHITSTNTNGHEQHMASSETRGNPRTTKRMGRSRSPSNGNRHGPRRTRRTPSETSENTRRSDDDSQSTRSSTRSTSSSKSSLRLVFTDVSEGVRRVRRGPCLFPLDGDLDLPIRLVVRGFPRVSLLAICCSCPFVFVDVMCISFALLGLYDDIEKGITNILDRTCLILTEHPTWIPKLHRPREGYWDESAQPISYSDIPGHIDPRNLPYYISLHINDLYIGQDTTSISTDSIGTGIKNNETTMEQDRNDNKKLENCNGTSKQQEHQQKSQTISETSEECDGNVTSNRAKSTIIQQIYGPKGTNIQRTPSNAKKIHITSTNTNGHEQHMASSETRGNPRTTKRMGRSRSPSNGNRLGPRRTRRTPSETSENTRRSDDDSQSTRSRTRSTSSSKYWLYDDIEKGITNILDRTCLILTEHPTWIPKLHRPREGYWDESAQPISYSDIPGHVDPRNLPYYISLHINDLYIGQDTTSISTDSIGTGIKNNETTMEQDRNDNKKLENCNGTSKQQEHQQKSQSISETSEECDGNVTSNRTKSTIIQQIYGPKGTNIQRTPSNAKEIHITSTNTNGHEQHMASSETRGNPRTTKRMGRSRSPSNGNRHGPRRTRRTPSETSENTRRSDDDSQSTRSSTRSTSSSKSSLRLVFSDVSEGVRRVRRGPCLFPLDGDLDLPIRLVVRGFPRVSLLAICCSCPLVFVDVMCISFALLGLYNDIEKGITNILDRTCLILTEHPTWIPKLHRPREGYWDESAQPISYSDIPGHVDPRNLPYYISLHINDLYIGQDTTSISTDSIGTGIKNNETTMEQDRNDNKKLENCNGTSKQQEHQQKSQTISETSEECDGNVTSNRTKSTIIQQIYGPKGTNIQRTPSNAKEIHITSTNTNGHEQHMASSETRGNPRTTKRMGRSKSPSNGNRHGPRRTRRTPSETSENTRRSDDDSQSTRSSTRSTSSSKSSLRLVFSDVSEGVRRVRRGPCLFPLDGDLDLPIRLVVRGFPRVSLLAICCSCPFVFVDVMCISFALLGLYDDIEKGITNILDRTCLILTEHPTWIPKLHRPREGYWDESAQPISYSDIPGHADPRNLPYYISLHINDLYIGQDTTSISTDSIGTGIKNNETTMEQDRNDNKKLENCNGTSKQQEHQQKSQTISETSEECDGNVTSNRAKSTIIQQIYGPKGTNIQRTPSNAKKIHITSTNTNGHEQHMASSETRGNPRTTKRMGRSRSPSNGNRLGLRRTRRTPSETSENTRRSDDDSQSTRSRTRSTSSSKYWVGIVSSGNAI
ncbi:hypothetical protein Pmani_002595 [Petrolisthes manimaculis]|uniref:Uncharacterized protein n=2 Tax=Petrolisthes manimaculis TaxID=1843537 RepID=A0AAE1QK19_9EUCA|nr:hypothetical protein Pmani_002595 [Petrolisthes manimaculis]